MGSHLYTLLSSQGKNLPVLYGGNTQDHSSSFSLEKHTIHFPYLQSLHNAISHLSFLLPPNCNLAPKKLRQSYLIFILCLCYSVNIHLLGKPLTPGTTRWNATLPLLLLSKAWKTNMGTERHQMGGAAGLRPQTGRGPAGTAV